MSSISWNVDPLSIFDEIQLLYDPPDMLLQISFLSNLFESAIFLYYTNYKWH